MSSPNASVQSQLSGERQLRLIAARGVPIFYPLQYQKQLQRGFVKVQTCNRGRQKDLCAYMIFK
jgi:hypothetical protein